MEELHDLLLLLLLRRDRARHLMHKNGFDFPSSESRFPFHAPAEAARVKQAQMRKVRELHPPTATATATATGCMGVRARAGVRRADL